VKLTDAIRSVFIDLSDQLNAGLNALVNGVSVDLVIAHFKLWWSNTVAANCGNGMMQMHAISNIILDEAEDLTSSATVRAFITPISGWVDDRRTNKRRFQYAPRFVASINPANIYPQTDSLWSRVLANVYNVATGHKPSTKMIDNVLASVNEAATHPVGNIYMTSVFKLDATTGLMIPDNRQRPQDIAYVWDGVSYYHSGKKIPIGKNDAHYRIPHVYYTLDHDGHMVKMVS